ncbi:MAG: mismatch-specific DNA-glycosylase [Actinomycetes bacterium]
MARLTREELEAHRGRTVPDLVGDGTRLLFVGINPGLMTAARQTHFCHPSNRFYPALRRAGIVDWDLDASTGLTDAQRADLVAAGIGITNIVEHATARADELSADDLRAGATRLTDRVASIGPKVVAILGVTAYRTAFDRPGAVMGRQPEDLAGAELWVGPNPSGLNAHVTIDSMADWVRTLAEAAGIEPRYSRSRT